MPRARAVQEATFDTTPMAKRPIGQLLCRWLLIVGVVALYIVFVRPIKGLGALAAGKEWSRTDADAAFTDQMLGMSLGWSLNPLLEAVFFKVFNAPGLNDTMQVTYSLLYAVSVASFAILLLRWAFASSDPGSVNNNKASAQTDAGYDNGGGGD